MILPKILYKTCIEIRPTESQLRMELRFQKKPMTMQYENRLELKGYQLSE